MLNSFDALIALKKVTWSPQLKNIIQNDEKYIFVEYINIRSLHLYFFKINNVQEFLKKHCLSTDIPKPNIVKVSGEKLNGTQAYC